MTEKISPRYGVSRVDGDTLDLLEDDEIRIMKITALQCSVVRQMCFPWVFYYERLVNEFPSYWEVVTQPQAYKDSLEELELMMGGGYVPPEVETMGDTYVNRTNASANDFSIGSGLTADGTWRTLDLSSIVTDTDATVAHLRGFVKDNVTDSTLQFRVYGATGAYSIQVLSTQVANLNNYGQFLVGIPVLRQLEYKITSGMDSTGIVIIGWWKPTYGYGA